MHAFIFSLPQDIFHDLADYLLEKDQQCKEVFQFSPDWRNFINTSNRHFGEWKKQSQLIALNSSVLVRKFEKSSIFRERIYSMVYNPLQQVELSYSSLHIQPQAELVNWKNIVPGIKKVSATNCTVTAFPPNVDTVDLCQCAILEKPCDWPTLRNLFFTNGAKVMELDVSKITIVEEVRFSNIELVNYHALSHLKSLTISGANSITDVSCFRNATTLKLYLCQNVTDVSSLRAVHDLALCYCRGITDISSLRTVPKLTIMDCSAVADYSAAGNAYKLMINLKRNVVKDLSILNGIQILELHYCPQSTNFAALKNLRELHLDNFQGKDLSCLQNLEILHLSNCPHITNLSMLKKLIELRTNHSPSLSNLSYSVNLRQLVANFKYDREMWFSVSLGLGLFPGLREVDLVGMDFNEQADPTSVSSWGHWTNIRKMTLIESSFQTFPSTYTNLRELEVISCDCSRLDLPELPSLGRVALLYCLGRFNLNLLGMNSSYPVYKVEITGCDGLKQIRIARTVSSMIVSDCRALSIFEIHCQIGQLKIVDCPKLLNVREFAPILVRQVNACH
jgi:hypothetical protein